MKKFCLIICLSLTLGLFTGASANAEKRARALTPRATCKEFRHSIFKPCVCYDRVPKTIQYFPKSTECGGKAAAILSGPFAGAFSVVLRDKMNRDRWPASGYNGCSEKETKLGLNKCSAFKCQKVIDGVGSQTCCFGEKGTSKIMAGATRMTLKLKDIPNSTKDPLVRVCLNRFSPKLNLN